MCLLNLSIVCQLRYPWRIDKRRLGTNLRNGNLLIRTPLGRSVIFQHRDAMAHARSLVGLELPRPQLGIKQLVHLLERAAGEFGDEEDGKQKPQHRVSAQKPTHVRTERSSRRPDQVGNAEGDDKSREDIYARSKADD